MTKDEERLIYSGALLNEEEPRDEELKDDPEVLKWLDNLSAANKIVEETEFDEDELFRDDEENIDDYSDDYEDDSNYDDYEEETKYADNGYDVRDEWN